MKTSLESFNKGLDELKHYIQYLEKQSNLYIGQINEKTHGEIGEKISSIKTLFAKFPGAKKRFEYNTIIISLYGFFETYIEGLIVGYVNSLSSIVSSFDNLPEEIKKYHLELSFTLINSLHLRQNKGKATPQELISNLHSCFSRDECFIINAEAFAQHKANLRLEVIDTLFTKVGINKISESHHCH